jgi:hypothetical protein
LAKGDVLAVRAKVARLERLVVDAIGSPADRQAIGAGGAS